MTDVDSAFEREFGPEPRPIINQTHLWWAIPRTNPEWTVWMQRRTAFLFGSRWREGVMQHGRIPNDQQPSH